MEGAGLKATMPEHWHAQTLACPNIGFNGAKSKPILETLKNWACSYSPVNG